MKNDITCAFRLSLEFSIFFDGPRRIHQIDVRAALFSEVCSESKFQMKAAYG